MAYSTGNSRFLGNTAFIFSQFYIFYLIIYLLFFIVSKREFWRKTVIGNLLTDAFVALMQDPVAIANVDFVWATVLYQQGPISE